MLRQGRTTATRAVAEPAKCVLHCLLCALQQQVRHSAASAAAEPAVMPAAPWRVWLLQQNLLIAAQSGVWPAVRESNFGVWRQLTLLMPHDLSYICLCLLGVHLQAAAIPWSSMAQACEESLECNAVQASPPGCTWLRRTPVLAQR